MSINIFKAIAFVVAFGCISPAFAQTESQIVDFTKAAKFDDLSEVKSLVAAGVNPNTVDPNGDPMLLIAVREKSMKVIEFLLNDKKIDVDLSNRSGETPLMMASIDGDLPVIKMLVLQNKAKVDHIGWTPLHYACTKGHLEVAQFLIANGANVNAQSPNGTTPLMMAALDGNEELIKYLLDNGADMRMRNVHGLSVIDIAEIYQKPWIAQALASRWQKLYKEPYPGPQKFISKKSS